MSDALRDAFLDLSNPAAVRAEAERRQAILRARGLARFHPDGGVARLLPAPEPSLASIKARIATETPEQQARPAQPLRRTSPRRISAKPVAPPPTEHEEQVAFIARVAALTPQHPDFDTVYAIPNFSGRMKIEPVAARLHSVRLSKEGRKKGTPDLHYPAPRGAYHSLYLEMKRQRGGGLEPEQVARIAALRALGHRVEVCRGCEAAVAALLAYEALGPFTGSGR